MPRNPSDWRAARGYVGEAFIGVDVALERSETSDLILVRYANVRLGKLDTSGQPRLLPAFLDEGWETKSARAKTQPAGRE